MGNDSKSGTTPNDQKPSDSKFNSIKKKVKKFLIFTSLILIVIVSIAVYWKYFYTFSEGYRAGMLQKFSNKGFVFKTYEAEMILSSVTSTSNVALASEKFFFSVTSDKLAAKFDTLQGMNIVVHYVEKNSALSWRGESKYLVDSVIVKR